MPNKIKTFFLVAAITLLTAACAPIGSSLLQQKQSELAEYRARAKINEENQKRIDEEKAADNKAVEEKRKAKSEQDLKNQLEAIRSRFQLERDKMARENEAADILRKKPGVRIGMTTSNVMNETSWGFPDKINRTSTRGMVTEQWVYKSGYLYFRNNKLYAIQN